MAKRTKTKVSEAKINTPSDLTVKQVKACVKAINPLVADLIALWVKVKNYHWHMSGRNFRDYHELLDDQSAELLASIDPLAERVRKLGGKTITSIGQIAKLQRVEDNNAALVAPRDMLLDLMDENKSMAHNLREAHGICDDNDDIGTASLLEDYLDQTERRTWFLFEMTREIL